MENFNLENYGKIETGFKAPENYFDTLHSRILLRKEQKPVISFAAKYKTYIAIAAVLLIALLIPSSWPQKHEDIDQATLESYFAYSENAQFDILTEMSADEIASMRNQIPIDDQAVEDILLTNSNLEQLILE